MTRLTFRHASFSALLLIVSACAGAQRSPVPSRIDLAVNAPRSEIYQRVLAAFIAEGLDVNDARPSDGVISARHRSDRAADGSTYAVTYAASLLPTDSGTRVVLSATVKPTSPPVRVGLSTTRVGAPPPANVRVTPKHYPEFWARLVRLESAVRAGSGAVQIQ